MKKKAICIIAALMLCTSALPAGAFRYDADAPESKASETFAQAVEWYEVNEAVRLGLAPVGLWSDYGKTVTQEELAETALRVYAAYYGYDLENFLAACAVKRPGGTANQAVAGDGGVIDWAKALGLTEGEFSPNTAVTGETAAVLWSKTAALCGVTDGVKGGSGTYTRKNCLEDALNLSRRAGRAETPLLTAEEERTRLKAAFSSVEKELETDAGTVVYGQREGAPALCIAYTGGGARTIPMPAPSLTYLSDLLGYAGLLDVYGPDGQIYEIDLYSGSSAPVNGDDRLYDLKAAPENEDGVTYVLGGAPQTREKDEYGGYSQRVDVFNGSAAPHILRHQTSDIYWNNGRPWTAYNYDYVVFQFSAERVQGNPDGQDIQVGYISDGKMTEMKSGTLLGDGAIAFGIPKSGEYLFYVRNSSASSLYLTSVTVTIYHEEHWERTNMNDLKGTED